MNPDDSSDSDKGKCANLKMRIGRIQDIVKNRLSKTNKREELKILYAINYELSILMIEFCELEDPNSEIC